MKVLLVTGSSRGIGAEISRQAAADGWKVCINYASSEDEAERLVAQIRDAGGIAIALQANVANEDEIITLFERVDLELGPVTGLVNNAGVNCLHPGVTMTEISVDYAKEHPEWLDWVSPTHQACGFPKKVLFYRARCDSTSMSRRATADLSNHRIHAA